MTVPLLGFGTASILGSHGRRDSERAIRSALDAGIRHFDTARSYGWGEAEAVLGPLLKRVPRDEIVLVSKCGLVPVRQSTALRFAKAAARRLIATFPSMRAHVQRAASNQAVQPARTYDLATLDRSVRESLANLATPYLDVLLLHNFEAGKPGLAEVVAWMRTLQSQGTIRAYGFSVEGDLIPDLEWLADEGLLDGAVIQTPLVDALLHLPPRFAATEFIVHSPFRYLQSIREQRPGVTFVDLLREVSHAIKCRAIVCSMFSESHRVQNIAAVKSAFAAA